MRFAADRVIASGPDWIEAPLELLAVPPEQDDEAVPPEMAGGPRIAYLRSPVLSTTLDGPPCFAGMHYTKLLTPTQALEWVLFDAWREVQPASARGELPGLE